MDEAARVGLIHTVRAERDAGIAGEMDEAARVGLIHTVIEQGQTRYVRRNG